MEGNGLAAIALVKAATTAIYDAMIGPMLALAIATAAPSINCAGAVTLDESAICADPALADADALLARLYERASISAFGKGPSGETISQRQWLQRRDCKPSASSSRAECLRAAYAERNYELATAIAVRDPDLALPVLRRLDPEGAALIEAVVLVALRPAGTPWQSPVFDRVRPQLVTLLTPYAKRLFDTEEWSYGRDILADEGVRSLDQSLASEKSFTSFVQVTSAYLTEGPVIPRPLPCEALVRHPGLAEATGPKFGSTFDNFIVTSDCDAMLPPTPAFDRLVEAIAGSWPECQGTIRFSAYRTFSMAVDVARLASGKAGLKIARLPSVRGIRRSMVDASLAELSATYVRYGRATSANAAALAREKIAEVLVAAHNCND